MDNVCACLLEDSLSIRVDATKEEGGMVSKHREISDSSKEGRRPRCMQQQAAPTYNGESTHGTEEKGEGE